MCDCSEGLIERERQASGGHQAKDQDSRRAGPGKERDRQILAERPACGSAAGDGDAQMRSTLETGSASRSAAIMPCR